MNREYNEIPLKSTVITDKFWKDSIDLVSSVIIPYQWKILNDSIEGVEPSHCIHNLKVAAGEAEGSFMGAVFQDTDVAKWLEAAAYSLETNPDEELEKQADETIELIGRAQQADGYLDTYYTIMEPEGRFTNLQEGHELYIAGHMIEAAVAYYQATGKDRFLQIVCKLADLLCDYFGPGEDQCHGYPGHQEIELALVKLYRITGKSQYLELAKYFIEERGQGENYFLREVQKRGGKQIFPEFASYDPSYSQSHLPVREQTTAEGHAVRAVYMYSAMADLALEYKDETLLSACKTLWNNIVEKRIYITGGIGSSGILERFTTDYDLPNDRNYSETCASIGMAMFGNRMARITRDASYVDVVERELYNNILAGIAMDGKSFFYVNPLEVWPDNCISRTSMEHVKPVRQTWFGVACCPPNIARTLASLGQYLCFEAEDKTFVNLYISSTIKTCCKGKSMVIKLESSMPWKGECSIEITYDGEMDGEAAFRIPAYAGDFTLMREDGTEVEFQIEKGYALLSGLGTNERFTAQWSMEPVFVRANPKVRADAGKVALMKGPVLYCLEEIDNGNNLSAVFADTKKKIEESWEPELLGGVLTLGISGKRLSEESWEDNHLYGVKQPELRDVELKAVPYARWCNRTPGEMTVWVKELF